MKDIVIIGAGGFGREVAWLIDDINASSKQWNLLGYIDDNEAIHGEIINGIPVLGGLKWLEDNSYVHYVCAIGNALAKKKVVERCTCINMKAATLVHPTVLKSRYVSIGEGSIICAHNILTVNIQIGVHVIINLDCTIGHDAVINDYCTIYPSVNVSGNTLIGSFSEIGTGTQIIQGINIGSNTIIGAGAVVVKDLPCNCTAVGAPAKPIKFNQEV